MPIRSRFFELALCEARRGYLHDEVPVGAVLVRDGNIIASSANRVQSLDNPLMHAEIVVLGRALDLLGSFGLRGCDLYVTLEPCPMCSHAISLTRIRRVYFGADSIDTNGSYEPQYYGGFKSEETSRLLKDFFFNLRGHKF